METANDFTLTGLAFSAWGDNDRPYRVTLSLAHITGVLIRDRELLIFLTGGFTKVQFDTAERAGQAEDALHQRLSGTK